MPRLASLALVVALSQAGIERSEAQQPGAEALQRVASDGERALAVYDAAIREYRQVLTAAPHRPGIHFRIGRVLLERSKNDASSRDALEARRAFEEELAQDPTNANAAYELAEMDRRVGEFERGRTLFEQAVAHYPAFEHAQIGLARVLIALGRPAEALPHLKAALAANPESDIAYYQVARAYRALGEPAAQKTALAEYTRLHTLAAQRTAAVPMAKQDVTPQGLDLKSPK